MNAFQALWQKEWKMTRLYHLFILIMIILITGLTYWKLSQYGREVMLFPVMMMFGLTVFYLPGYLLLSLAGESKQLHVWLHTPQSIHKLVGVKLLSGFIYSAIAMGIVTLIGYWIANGISEIQTYLADLFKLIILMGTHMLAGAVYFSLFLLLLWSIRQMLKNYIGKWSWLIIIGLFFVLPILYGMFQNTVVYDFLAHWGKVNLDASTYLSSLNRLDQQYQHVTVNYPVSFYIGSYFFGIIVAIIMYGLSTYLLDKKVEV